MIRHNVKDNVINKLTNDDDVSKDHSLSLLTGYKYRNDHNAVDTYVRVLK